MATADAEENPKRTKIPVTPCSEVVYIVGEASDSPSLGKFSVGMFMKIRDPEKSQGKRKKNEDS